MLGRFFSGARYLFDGFRLIAEPGLRWFLLVPIIANILLFALLFAWAKAMFSEGMTYLMSWIPEWLGFLEWAFWLIYFVAMILLIFYAFVSTANLIGAPFYGFLAEVVEQKLKGEKREEAMSAKELMLLVPRTVLRELRKLTYYIPRVLVLVILGLIPGINAIVALLWIVFSGWMMAVQYVDYPADNNNMSFGHLRKYLQQHRAAAMGFGLTTFALTLVPILNLFVLPAAVCGAVCFWVERNALNTTNHAVNSKALNQRD